MTEHSISRKAGDSNVQKSHRIRKNEEFSAVFRSGSSAANRQFVVYWKRKPGQPHFRLGVSASKKLGKAVVRNRMRRLVKEIVRLNGSRIAPECDLVVIVRKDATQMDYDQLERSLKHVLKKAGIWLPADASAAARDDR